jgi:NADH dehydrogenase FAD-containing subunit
MTNNRVLVLGGNFAAVIAALAVEHEPGRDVDVTVDGPESSCWRASPEPAGVSASC